MNEQLLTVKCCHVFFGGVMHLLKASHFVYTVF